MTTDEKTHHINQILQAYFDRHPASSAVPVKDFMPQFKKADLFSSQKTLRQFLRDLRKSKSLYQIPFVLTEEKEQKTFWFFAPAKLKLSLSNNHKPATKETVARSVSAANSKARIHSDECYVLDLCDEILGMNSVRQHRFPFLVGDPNSAGRCTRLPVDAWYEPINLVIEFNEKQHTEPVNHFDKRMTLSGINRGEQRLLYDDRKRTVLPQKGIQVIVLSYRDFAHNSRKQVLRSRDEDLKFIVEKMKQYKSTNTV